VKELTELTNDPPPGTTVKLVDESSVHEWEIHMEGPEGSPYAGGQFRLHLSLPKEYPFKPPVLSFATKIYHPNVSNDDKGSMCLGILRADSWKPPNKIGAVINVARSLLVEPNIDDAVESAIAEQWRSDRPAFEKTAREWTVKHAGGKK